MISKVGLGLRFSPIKIKLKKRREIINMKKKKKIDIEVEMQRYRSIEPSEECAMNKIKLVSQIVTVLNVNW